MSKLFDATVKGLLTGDLGAWLALARLTPDGPLTAIDTDLSTVSAAADGVVRVDVPSPWLVHFEFQADHDLTLGARLLRYNVLLGHHHDLPVQSVVFLLRPEANSPALTGTYERRLPDGRLCHAFHYLVVRIWERPVEEFLEQSLLTVPLAPIANVPPERVPEIVRRADERIRREAAGPLASDLRVSMFILLGSRYSRDFVARLKEGVLSMRESSMYEIILEEGMAEGIWKTIFCLGEAKFGPPSPDTEAEIKAITDVDRLLEMARRLLDVNSWDELLAPA